MEKTKSVKVPKSIICVIILCVITFLFVACNGNKYNKAIGCFESSNGSTLEVIEINESTITYQISVMEYSSGRRTDKFYQDEGRFVAYTIYSGVEIPLVYLKYDFDSDCWKNEAILPEPVLDFYRVVADK